LALVGPDGLAIDAGNATDLALAFTQAEQGEDGYSFVWLQDIHSETSHSGRSGSCPAKQVPGTPALLPVPDHEVAIHGRIGMTIGVGRGQVRTCDETTNPKN